jgi:thioredoxin 1
VEDGTELSAAAVKAEVVPTKPAPVRVKENSPSPPPPKSGLRADGSGANRPARIPANVTDLAQGGRSFSLKDVPVRGKVTVVDFWADWCRPCKKITKMLTEWSVDDPQLVIKKVEVPNFDSPVAMQHLFNVAGLPVVWIYDRSGKLAQKLVGTTSRDVRKAVKAIVESGR